MDDRLRQHYDTQSKDLRVTIKTWEALFQKEHNGSKPTKDDIKSNPKIGTYLFSVHVEHKATITTLTHHTHTAATYKEYQKARNILDGKIPPPRPTEDNKETHRRKRKSPNPPTTSLTPSTKRFKQAETPSSRNHHAQLLGQYTPAGGGGATTTTTAVTPSLSRKLFSPVVPTSIGPTPQRDGRVLGIFDHLPFKDAEIDSPCKPNASSANNKLPERGQKGREAAVQETPRKSSKTTDAATIALGRTPSSRHKRQQRQQSPRKSLLATPLKPHDGNRVAKTPSTSSSSVSRLQFATPAFLRRIPMAKITESSEYVSPEPLRLPRKPLLRGLSSVVADLRRLQEEQMDDDLEALRDIENEAAGGGGTDANNNKQQAPSKEADTPVVTTAVVGPPQQEQQKTMTKEQHDKEEEDEAAILAADHLALLGGFDDEGQFDDPDGDEENAGRDRDGRLLKVYKKKGQKRTTRRSNMRPVRTRRPDNNMTTNNEEGDHAANEPSRGDDNNKAQKDAAVQKKPPRGRRGEEDEDEQDFSGSDFAAAASEDDDEDELAKDMPITSRKLVKNSKKTDLKTATTTKTTREEKAGSQPEGKIKKAARKVNEFAHANFRRLKLRNNGAKGGPGYNSRFRRRR